MPLRAKVAAISVAWVERNHRHTPKLRRQFHAGYKVVGDKPLKLLTVHIVDKGKPMTVPAK